MPVSSVKFLNFLQLESYTGELFQYLDEGLQQILMAAPGSGQRRLIGETIKSRRSFLQLDISKDGRLERKVWIGPYFRELLNQSSLPDSIKLHGIELRLARP